MPTLSGGRPGKKLSMARYRRIVSDPDFVLGEWRADAACVTVMKNQPEKYSTDDWFPKDHSAITGKVAMVCKECTVRLECLSYAMLTRQPEGIWGGHTMRQIRKILRKITTGRVR